MPLLPPSPKRIAALKKDRRGFPVPWFVQWFENGEPVEYGRGEPDFRVIDSSKHRANIRAAGKPAQCWICGQALGRHRIFAIGPMCAVNRVTSEPPSHRECAEYAARACPFLTKPRMRRNDVGLDKSQALTVGMAIDRNPGATALWTTEHYKPFRAGDGYLLQLGEPTAVDWWAEGRKATRAEVVASIESSVPLLLEVAQSKDEIAEIYKYKARAERYLPGPNAKLGRQLAEAAHVD